MTLRRLRALTAGESHGPALLGILEGLPAGLPLISALIDRDLARRQKGYGRGGRMRIEQDTAEILAGVRFGETLGSPLGLLIHNKDWANWTDRMSPAPGGPDPRPVQVPRPGHTDLAGALKYGRNRGSPRHPGAGLRPGDRDARGPGRRRPGAAPRAGHPGGKLRAEHRDR